MADPVGVKMEPFHDIPSNLYGNSGRKRLLYCKCSEFIIAKDPMIVLSHNKGAK